MPALRGHLRTYISFLVVPWREGGKHLRMVNAFHYLKGPYSFFLVQGAISLDLPWDLAQEEAVFPGRAMNLVEGAFKRHNKELL